MEAIPYLMELAKAEQQYQMGQLSWEEFAQAQERFDRCREQDLEAISRRREREQNSIPLFLSSQGLFQYDPDGRCSSQELYSLYSLWCTREKILRKPSRVFSLYLKTHAEKYHLVYTMNIPTPQGKHCRGFCGIRSLAEADTHNTDTDVET